MLIAPLMPPWCGTSLVHSVGTYLLKVRILAPNLKKRIGTGMRASDANPSTLVAQGTPKPLNIALAYQEETQVSAGLRAE